ncbi:hypothetical protein Dsin_029483 [Dipteronia sinensis]|uniref:Reverse transcriptase domain-containing protein n=1 Tax=Dipteronia sinensis TaxID=43782 RepID=A0AAD9ZTT1_9ROSI|nr:hypothetical protein Dsin_029483 [Dipteronia sinensis]
MRPRMTGVCFKKLTEAESCLLEKDFNLEEVRLVLSKCEGNKAPGPDGFNLNFVKAHWRDIQEDFMNFMKEFHNDWSMVKDVNRTHVVLIPKVGRPETIKDFRPISLVSSMYKILAKVLANRLRKVMDAIIGESQMAFVKNRQISDSFVIAEEIIRKWKNDK